MYCNKCGAYMPDDAGFCPSCGARMPGQSQQIPVQAAPTRGKNSVLIAAITAVAVVLVACIVCFTVFMSRSTVGSQLEARMDTGAAQSATQDTQTDTATQGAASDTKTDAADAQDSTDGTATDDTTTVTNNYYYYGSSAASDDAYYTQSEDSEYLWPTDTEYISSSDLSGLSEDTVKAIRNEIYARHGYAFTSTRWQEYFASKTWYKRDSTCTEDTVNARLSSLERANIDTIVAYEESRGWR